MRLGEEAEAREVRRRGRQGGRLNKLYGHTYIYIYRANPRERWRVLRREGRGRSQCWEARRLRRGGARRGRKAREAREARLGEGGEVRRGR